MKAVDKKAYATMAAKFFMVPLKNIKIDQYYLSTGLVFGFVRFISATECFLLNPRNGKAQIWHGEVISINSKHICEQADANRFIKIPIYSEERNEDGTYDLIGYRKEYVD